MAQHRTNTENVNKQLILASSSIYRIELMKKLQIDFTSISPDIDESRRDAEEITDYVSRMARSKANEIAKEHSQAIIIGSDQCAVLENSVIGKSGSKEKAIQQLTSFANKRITFLTSLCLYGPTEKTRIETITPYHVHFRKLELEEIVRYVDKEQPFDCAGSFKSEGLGISLFNKLEGDDPNALIGLPLIQLCQGLRSIGYKIP